MALKVVNSELIKEFKEIFDKLKIFIQNEKPNNASVENRGDTPEQDAMSVHFNTLLKRIDEILGNVVEGSLDAMKLISMKASLSYEQAKVRLFNEGGADAQDMLQDTLKLIEPYSAHDYIIFLYLRIVNHLSYLLSKHGNLEVARNLLENVMDREFTPTTLVYSTEDIFSELNPANENAKAKFDKLMINNMQMLGWIYGKLGLHDSHTKIEHRSLQKQLNMEEPDPLQWTSKCCRLATLFLTGYNWTYARYYLATLGYVLDKFESVTKLTVEISQARADLARAWIHYGLHLYSASKKKMLEQLYDDGEPEAASGGVSVPTEISSEYRFTGLNTTIPNVPAAYIRDTQDARVLFVHTQTWLKQVRTYYTLRDFPLQYVNAVLDLSELYRFLAFYETDLESQYNVQKRRSEALEALSTLLREVRPNCYTVVSVELWRELAEVQIDLMGINLKRLYTFENEYETEESLKRRLAAVADVHNKLESIGDAIVPTASPMEDIIANDDQQPSETVKEEKL